MADPVASVLDEFRRFPQKYSLAPLWYWNDDLREDELLRQLKELKRAHVNEAMVFPMAGLVQPYLSPEYFASFRFVVQQARKMDMKIWVYDEYCWPSGTAGGLLLEQYPEYVQPALRIYRIPVARNASRQVELALPDGNLIWAEARRADGARTVPLLAYAGESYLRWKAPAGAWEVRFFVTHRVQRVQDSCTASRWTTDPQGYLDTMNREAVAKYIELVYQGHYDAVPNEFGKTVPGFFTDEPEHWYDFTISGGRSIIKPDGHRLHAVPHLEEEFADNPNLYGFTVSRPWSRDFLRVFEERMGYDLRPRLGELVPNAPADRKVAHDYFKCASDLFAECYSEQIGAWCGEHNVAFSGHYGEGPWNGDHYRQTRPQQVPGMDILGGIGKGIHLYDLARRIATVARVHDRDRVLSETHAATPLTFTLADKVRLADCLALAGINLQAPIDFAYSFRSFRKHTSNPPGFYQTSLWPYQRPYSDRVARICQITSAGKSTARIAVVYPSGEALSNGVPAPTANLALEGEFRQALWEGLQGQIEMDALYETALCEGRVRRGGLAYPRATYTTLLVPAATVLTREGLDVLGRFAKAGGRVVFYKSIPRQAPDGASLAKEVRKTLGGTAAMERAASVRETRCGKGRVVFVPDPMAEVQCSSDVGTGNKAVTPFDGTNSLFVTSRRYPQSITLDLGDTVPVDRLAVRIEPGKEGVEYRYRVETSNDQKRWTKRAEGTRRGKVHRLDLKGAKGRYLRLNVLEGERMYGLTALECMIHRPGGKTELWRPRRYRPGLMAELLPEHAAQVRFYEGEGLCPHLALTVRRLNKTDIVCVQNMGDQERTLTARLARPSAVRCADLDSGRTSRVAMDAAANAFSINFAPWETRVLLLDPAPKGRGRARGATLARARTPVQALEGPWTFQAERPNALPLAGARLEMADPARPNDWVASPVGIIPESMRRVPALLFRATFQARHAPRDAQLLFDELVVRELAVNGTPPAARPQRNRYLDAFGLSVPIGSLLKRGRNQITGLYMPELFERWGGGSSYNFRRLQPTLDAMVLGGFSVDERGRLVQAVTRLDERPWEEQGYFYYSGTGCYRMQVTRRGNEPVWLEADVRDGVLEVRVNGRKREVRLGPPYLVDLTRALNQGRNTLELAVTNPMGALLRKQAAARSLGRLRQPPASGLVWARLVRPAEA